MHKSPKTAVCCNVGHVNAFPLSGFHFHKICFHYRSNHLLLVIIRGHKLQLFYHKYNAGERAHLKQLCNALGMEWETEFDRIRLRDERIASAPMGLNFTVI